MDECSTEGNQDEEKGGKEVTEDGSKKEPDGEEPDAAQENGVTAEKSSDKKCNSSSKCKYGATNSTRWYCGTA